MPISKINTFGIADNAVISSKIAQDIVVADDIANNAVTVNELVAPFPAELPTTVNDLDDDATVPCIELEAIVPASELPENLNKKP